MEIVKAIKVFSEVARQGSFAAAARTLKLSTSSVSRQVSELEAWLNVALLRRTTRKLSLTEEGRYYLDELGKIHDDLNRVRATASDTIRQPSGTLRLTAPPFVVKECIQPVLAGFLSAYPEIAVELLAVDRFVDLVDEGFDLALRVGDLPDSSLVARRLGDTELTVVASPTYLSKRGTPGQPSDLSNHNCIVDTVAGFAHRWPMKQRGKQQTQSVTGNITVNSGEIARDLATQGVGLTMLPRFFVSQQLRDGILIEVLKDTVATSIGFYAVYPQSKHLAPRVRAFIDYVVRFLESRSS
ncbi:MAG: LysR family transcriptional regulator [Pseudomonadota bacterium]